MPIYEFLCKSCKNKASFFVRTYKTPENWVCPACGGTNLERCISKCAYHQGIKDIWEKSGPPSAFAENTDYYKDPRNIGRWAENKMKSLGVDLNSEEFRGVKDSIEAAREGELPKELK